MLEMLRVIREEEPPRPSTRAEHGGGLADARGQPRHGAGEADEAGARRAGLDRDEGAGEGPQPPLRDGQRLRGGRAALPGRRAGAGVPAVGGVPVPEVRAAEPARRWPTAASCVGGWSWLAVVGGLATAPADRPSRRHGCTRADRDREDVNERWTAHLDSSRDRRWPEPRAGGGQRRPAAEQNSSTSARTGPASGWEWHYLKRRCTVEPLASAATTEVNGGWPSARTATCSTSAAAMRAVSRAERRPDRRSRPSPTGSRHAWRSVYRRFSPDGTASAPAAADRTVPVWDLATEQVAACSPAATVKVRRRGLQPGRAACLPRRSADGTVTAVGRGERAERSVHPPGHRSSVDGVAFSPDGRRVATGRLGPRRCGSGTRRPAGCVPTLRGTRAASVAWRSAPTADLVSGGDGWHGRGSGTWRPAGRASTCRSRTGASRGWRSAPTADASRHRER